MELNFDVQKEFVRFSNVNTRAERDLLNYLIKDGMFEPDSELIQLVKIKGENKEVLQIVEQGTESIFIDQPSSETLIDFLTYWGINPFVSMNIGNGNFYWFVRLQGKRMNGMLSKDRTTSGTNLLGRSMPAAKSFYSFEKEYEDRNEARRDMIWYGFMILNEVRRHNKYPLEYVFEK